MVKMEKIMLEKLSGGFVGLTVYYSVYTFTRTYRQDNDLPKTPVS